MKGNIKIAFLFSGQGSQYFFMGESLFNRNKVFHDTMQFLDKKAVQLLGHSVIDYLYDINKSRSTVFDRLLFSHPALFMIQYSMAKAIMAEGIIPSYACGYSLGEVVAASVSGMVSPLDGLSLLIEQAKLVEENCPKGGMIVVFQKSVFYYQTSLLYNGSSIIGEKFGGQFTISGLSEKLDKIEEYLRAENILFQRLPIRYAYHCKYIEPIKLPYFSVLKEVSFQESILPFISSVYGCELRKIDTKYMWDIARKPILFQDAVQHIEDMDCVSYIDMSPSGELKNFISPLLKKESLRSFSILNPWRRNELQSFEEIKARFSSVY